MLVIEIITTETQVITIPQAQDKHIVLRLCKFCEDNLVQDPTKFCCDNCRLLWFRKMKDS